MSYRRFFVLNSGNTPFVFTVDTTKINVGATDGSENNLTFRLPLRNVGALQAATKCIVKVSDGRPDISIVGTSEVTSKGLITFSTPGIYQIKIYGFAQFFGFYYRPPTANYYGQDYKKMASIDSWGNSVKLDIRTFYQCENLIIKANNTLVLPLDTSWLFQGIKGFESSLTLIDTSKATSVTRLLFGISNVLPDNLNPFWLSLTNFESVYSGNTFSSSLNKIEIISSTLERLFQPFDGITFLNAGTIELICDTPNLKTMFRVFYSGEVRTRCHAGKIDVRNVTDPTQWITLAFTTAQVDATLLGWANLPFMQSGVTWDWKGSKYSNNPAVIAALNRITNDWGVIFTNLTMV